MEKTVLSLHRSVSLMEPRRCGKGCHCLLIRRGYYGEDKGGRESKEIFEMNSHPTLKSIYPGY